MKPTTENPNKNPLAEFLFINTAVRVFGTTDNPLFVAKDVCEILGLQNSRKACADLDYDEKGVTTGYTLGGVQEVTVVTESGLYALIFKSRKPEARAFKKFVTSEILPALRRQGYYVAAGRDPLQARVERGRALLAMAEQLEAEAKARRDEAKRLLTLEDHTTVKAFCHEHGLGLEHAESLKAFGYAQKAGIPMGMTKQDGRTVLTYPRAALITAFGLNQTPLLLN